MTETDIQACILTCVRVHGDLQDLKLVKNKPIMPILAPSILNIQSGAAILSQDIFNDYLWSYMIETDMPACVLTFYRIQNNLQDKKLVKNMAKIQVLPPPKSGISSLVP